MASPENAEGDRVDPEKKEDTGPSFVETGITIPTSSRCQSYAPTHRSFARQGQNLNECHLSRHYRRFCRDICILFAPRATSQRRDSHLGLNGKSQDMSANLCESSDPRVQHGLGI